MVESTHTANDWAFAEHVNLIETSGALRMSGLWPFAVVYQTRILHSRKEPPLPGGRHPPPPVGVPDVSKGRGGGGPERAACPCGRRQGRGVCAVTSPSSALHISMEGHLNSTVAVSLQ